MTAVLVPALLLMTNLVLAQDGCPKQPLADFYTELGCSPRLENGSKCPTSYDCSSHETRDKAKCYYQEKVYNMGEELGDLVPACSADCSCRPGIEESTATIECANIECPEEFNGQEEPGCYHTYDHESCCSKATLCYQKDMNPTITCQHGNSTYHEGERFYPEEAPCKVCICSAGYQGRPEPPFCQDIKCNTQLHSLWSILQGCVPVFYGSQGCCPIDWRCPENEDKVRKALTKEKTGTKENCRFGKLVLLPGDTLELLQDSPNVECTCRLPPYLTCIQRQ